MRFWMLGRSTNRERAGHLATAAYCLVFAVLVAATQLGSLFAEVIDWDESTFILMAQDVADGRLPYLYSFDNKPPLMFFALGGAMAAFGETLLTVRLFGDICLLIVAIATFAVARRADGAFAAGLSVAVMIAASMVSGVHTQTEHLAMALLMPALCLLVFHRGRLWSAALAGLLLSLAVLTRLNLAFVVVAAGFYYAAAPWRPLAEIHRHAVYAFVAAGLLPVIAFGALYAWQENLDTFVLSVVEVPISYAVRESGPLWNLLRHLDDWADATLQYPAIFIPFTLLILAAPFALTNALRRFSEQSWHRAREERLIVLLFAGAILVSILFGGAAYSHYWNQIFPFFAIFGAAVLAELNVRARLLNALSAIAVVSALVLFGPASFRVLTDWNAVEARHHIHTAAGLIAGDRRPGDRVWALENHLVLWYLGDAQLSRAATHPSNIVRESILLPLTARGYVGVGELYRVQDSKPKYLVTDAARIPNYLGAEDADAYLEFLAGGYALWRRVGDVAIYRRTIDFKQEEFFSATVEKMCRFPRIRYPLSADAG